MARLLLIPSALIGLLVAVMIWSGSASDQRADFAFINRGDNKSLDPNNMSWMQDIRLAYALWEGLYALDPTTLQPILGSAASVDLSPDKRIYTFHIRSDARWSNGEALLARDFLFEFRRMLETPGEYTYLHHYIQGAQAYEAAYSDYLKAKSAGHAATAPDFSTVGEQALDERTLRITLTHPVPFFPSLCAFPPFFPMHEPSMRKFADIDTNTGQTTYRAEFTRPPNLVTNGPYRMADWTFKRRVRLIANDFYWDHANVKSRVIDQVYDEEPLAAFRLYEQGDVDWLADVDPEIAAAIIRKGGRGDLHVFPAFGSYYYDFNCQPKLPDGRINPLADVRVRQALVMAIDKVPIVRDVGRLGQPITSDYIPPGVFPGYQSPPGLSMNVARARQLLAEAGYPGGKGFPNLSILFNTENFHGDIAVIIRRQWLDNLGIDVDLEGVEVKVFGGRKHSHDFTIARGGWYGDYKDPSTFTDKYLTGGDNNDGVWSNKQYDDLCAQAAIETDPAKRFALLSRAENVLLTDAAIMPLYIYTGAYMFHNNVLGVPLDSQQMVMFKAVQVMHLPEGVQ
jgi:oligopeptide transport system substrate-binding protein